jgi:hypothetical protein
MRDLLWLRTTYHGTVTPKLGKSKNDLKGSSMATSKRETEVFEETQRLIVVAAHGDDLETMCGGTVDMEQKRKKRQETAVWQGYNGNDGQDDTFYGRRKYSASTHLHSDPSRQRSVARDNGRTGGVIALLLPPALPAIHG